MVNWNDLGVDDLANLDVTWRGPNGKILDRATAAEVFGGRLNRLRISDSQDAGGTSPASDRWLLTIGGDAVGELRSRAGRRSIHIEQDNGAGDGVGLKSLAKRVSPTGFSEQ